MHARCAMLAHKIVDTPGIFRCPTSMHRFHYHGTDRREPYRLLVKGSPCTHRHQTPTAAATCTANNA